MTEEEFVHLVQKAEREIEKDPTKYKVKLALFAFLGYLVIFTLLLILAALTGGVVAVAFISTSFVFLLLKSKIIIPIFVMAWILAKSLWVRFEKPQGHVLDRQTFPTLFNEIDDLRGKLDSLPIHQVILTPELNAAVVQTPRLGIFGWQHNTLILGLELLLILSPEEARSVLAHEFGHLSKNHSRFSGWIYRIRTTWDRIMEEFHQNTSWGGKLLQHFFNWYSPHFSAYSFALARGNEYEADATAAEITSKTTVKSALINTHVTEPYISQAYWNEYFKKADTMPEPDHGPYRGLAAFLHNHSRAEEAIGDIYNRELKRETVYSDTHPSLSDRLKALGGEIELPASCGEDNAAAAWLDGKYQEVIEYFDSNWLEYNSDTWRERYNYVQEARQKLDHLEQTPPDELSQGDHWDLARLTEELKPDRDPLPLYQHYKQRFPADPNADFAMGRILYGRNDDDCLGYLEGALAHPDLYVEACRIAYYYLLDKDRREEAERWRQLAVERIDYDEKAAAERRSVEPKDPLTVPAVSEELENKMAEKLLATGCIKSAWLAQKEVRYKPEAPVYIIAFSPRGFTWSWEKVMEKVTRDLAFSEDVFLIVNGGDYRYLARRVIKAGKKII